MVMRQPVTKQHPRRSPLSGQAHISTWHRYATQSHSQTESVIHCHTADPCCIVQEATGLNAEQGYPFGTIVTAPKPSPSSVQAEDDCFGATDVFSFGLMLYVMFTRSPLWFDDEGRDPGVATIKGVKMQDMKKVATWYYEGMRPSFDDLQAPHQLFGSFPPMLRLLIEGCWAGKQADRLRFSEIEALLSNEKQSIDWLEMPQAASYDEWLTALELQDRKSSLAEWDVKEGETPEQDPLATLVQMLKEEQDEESEDFAEMLEDLFEGDADGQAKFRAAVVELATPAGDDGMDSSGGATAGVPPAKRLRSMLGQSSLEEQLAAKDAVIAAKDAVIAAKDDEKAAALAEVAELKAQLGKLRAPTTVGEGAPPE
jgi:hypothetical protein